MPLPVHLNSHFGTIVSTPYQLSVTKFWREDTKVVADRWITVSWIDMSEHWRHGLNESNWVSFQCDVAIAPAKSNADEF